MDDGRSLFGPGQQQADRAQQDDAQAHAPQPKALDHQYAQRRADGQGAVAGNAVPGNHFGRVGSPDPADAPAYRARTHQAFGAAQHQSASQQAGQAPPGQVGQEGAGQHEHAADAAAGKAVDHGFLAAMVVDDAAGGRAAEQGRQVLHADHQAGDDGTETQVVVYVAGQYGQRNADVQVANEGEQNDGDDLQGDRKGAG